MILPSLVRLPILLAFLSMIQACTGSTEYISCTLGSGNAVTVSGQASYERVNLNTGGALDFNDIDVLPVRKAVVVAMCGNQVIDESMTDTSGAFSLSVPGNSSNVYIRVKAQMIQAGNPGWDVAVSDVTQAEELIYSMDGGLFDVGTQAITRNLLAKTGWSGSDYTASRVAAPFAILDTVYDSMQLVLSVSASTRFPALDIKWGPDNTNGTFYSRQVITVLGSSSDSDEFDKHVIAHEWGHYFQDMFSRDDSPGGRHSLIRMLDIRLAFSEGFGNAFSAMVTGEPLYKDSQSVALQDGFSFNLETNNCGSNDGWYNECSVQSILYDLFDDATEDPASYGFAPIYNELTGSMTSTPALTSLFSFIHFFKANNTGDANVDTLLTAQGSGSFTDEFGAGVGTAGYAGELNSASNPVIPVYSTDTGSFTLCSTGENGGYNGYGVNRFAKITGQASVTYTATKAAGESNATDPDLYIIDETGGIVASGESFTTDSETVSALLNPASTYVLLLQEFRNYSDPDYNQTAPGADNVTCFDINRS